jgi:DNA-binding beta-propeller fold protein YncE
MNFCQARVRLVLAGAVLTAAALISGCGNNYRPVVTPVNPSGPASQPESLVAVVSAPSTTAAGIATIIDYAGDTVLAEAPIGPGPSAFTVDETGSNGYTINSDGTLTNFPVSNLLQEKSVIYTTLLSTAKPVNLFSPASGLWVADLCATIAPANVCESAADVFTGSPQTFLLSIPVAPAPVMVAGPGLRGQRYFALSQNIASPTGVECNSSPAAQPLGVVTGIEVANNTTDAPTMPVGKCPVYAVESSDNQRLFVLNRGSDTITVINAANDTLDQCVCPATGCLNQANQAYTCHPTLPLSTTAGLAQDANNDVPAVAGPVYAEYNTATSQLVVANYAGGTISIIDVSLDQWGNDSPTFGTTYTVPVGKNPASVTVLLDGSRAYTANQADETVSVVYLGSHTLKTTLPVTGHPRTVVSTQNSTYGKVYVASPDSNVLTIIGTGGTNPDTVDTTVPVTGYIVDVRVSTQNGSSGNNNNLSRVPGYGQPCNLPLKEVSVEAMTSHPELCQVHLIP